MLLVHKSATYRYRSSWSSGTRLGSFRTFLRDKNTGGQSGCSLWSMWHSKCQTYFPDEGLICEPVFHSSSHQNHTSHLSNEFHQERGEVWRQTFTLQKAAAWTFLGRFGRGNKISKVLTGISWNSLLLFSDFLFSHLTFLNFLTFLISRKRALRNSIEKLERSMFRERMEGTDSMKFCCGCLFHLLHFSSFNGSAVPTSRMPFFAQCNRFPQRWCRVCSLVVTLF